MKNGDDSGIIYVENDNEAGNHFYELLRPNLICCGGKLFLKDNHIWINDHSAIETKLLNIILSSKIFKTNAKGDDVSYAQDIPFAKRIREALLAKIKDSNVDNKLYDKFHDTTKGYLCFQDGLLDFKNNRFILWDDVDFPYYSVVMIERNFAEAFNNPVEEDIKGVENILFKNLFGEKTQDVLWVLSRTMAGHYEDKRWLRFLGNRDCGKGFFDCSTKFTFGDYIQNVSSNNFMCDRAGKGGEDARDFEWAGCLEFARIGISQESQDDSKKKVNGNVIKKICSGGDRHKCRKIYENTREIVIEALLIFMGNDSSDPTPSDTMETCLDVSSVKQFKSQEYIDNQVTNGSTELELEQFALADPEVKNKSKTDAWANAYTHLVLRNYRNFPYTILRSAGENDEICSVRKLILKGFTITTKDTDFVSNEIIKNWRAKFKVEVGDKKLKIEMEALGLKPDNRRVGGVRMRGYTGLVSMLEDEDEIDEEY